MTYLDETFGNKNRTEKWFREVKVKTKRFYNNINAKTLKSMEELEVQLCITLLAQKEKN
jgi:hypothetical protein